MTGNDVVVRAFTEMAPGYEQEVDGELRQFWGVGYEEFIDRLLGVVPVNEGDVILDVATGTAFIPRKLVDKVGHAGRVVGLDITPSMLERGQKNVEAAAHASRINLVCASAMDMPFVEGHFDTALCALGTHHMDVPKLVAEMRRVLKVGGRLVITDVGSSAFWRSFWGTALLNILVFIYKLAHWSSFRAQAEVQAFANIRTADEWHTLLSELGFVEIKVTEAQARRRWYPCALTMRAVAGQV